jgi:hypothetical protein
MPVEKTPKAEDLDVGEIDQLLNDDQQEQPGDEQEDEQQEETQQGQDDQQGDDQPQDDEEDADDVSPAPARKGPSQVIREAKARAREAEREAAELRAWKAERERQERERSTEMSPDQERAYLDTLTPEERVDYKLAKAERRDQIARGQMAFQTADTADRLEFNSKLATSPMHSKFASEVEATLADIRSKGQNAPRETVLAYIIGQKVLQRQNAPARKQVKKQAQQRVASQRVPGNGTARGDQATERRPTGKTAEDRLTGVAI